jgi:hypothetical protein
VIFCPSRITSRPEMLRQLSLTVPESRFRVPTCSGVSTNVSSGRILVSIVTRCFAATGPAAATDVSVNAATNTASTM